MKTGFLINVCIALAIIFFLLTPELPAQKTSLKPYGIKSGIIEYKLSGIRSGISILYFDDYGLKNANKNNIVMQGKTDNKWIISLKEDQYIFDTQKPDEGIKMKNPFLKAFYEMGQSDYNKFVDEFYSKMGFKKSGKQKYLDKECIVYKGELGKVLIWNGIMLYSESDFAGVSSKQEATSIKINVPVDDKYFQIPKNIKFKDAPDLDELDKMIEDNTENETE